MPPNPTSAAGGPWKWWHWQSSQGPSGLASHTGPLVLPKPSQQDEASFYPQPLPSNIVVFINYDEFPQLWCAPGEYSLFGQVPS